MMILLVVAQYWLALSLLFASGWALAGYCRNRDLEKWHREERERRRVAELARLRSLAASLEREQEERTDLARRLADLVAGQVYEVDGILLRPVVVTLFEAPIATAEADAMQRLVGFAAAIDSINCRLRWRGRPGRVEA